MSQSQAQAHPPQFNDPFPQPLPLHTPASVNDTDMVSFIGLHPSYAHFFLAALYQRGLVQHIVTQNIDDLHSKSGIPPEGLSEIHGNVFVERCTQCGSTYKRPFHAAKNTRFRRHLTGRHCESGAVCGGELADNIVHRGERVDGEVVAEAKRHSQVAQLSIVFGSSLTVPPACSLPVLATKNKWTVHNVQPQDSVIGQKRQRIEAENKGSIPCLNEAEATTMTSAPSVTIPPHTGPVLSSPSRSPSIASPSPVHHNGGQRKRARATSSKRVEHGKLAIVNLQPTGKDKYADPQLLLRGPCDRVCQLLAEALDIEVKIPPPPPPPPLELLNERMKVPGGSRRGKNATTKPKKTQRKKKSA